MSDAIIPRDDTKGGALEKPTTCPACLTQIPPGRERCPTCGRYSDAVERCPHCNNPSPAVPYFSRSGAGCMLTALYALGGFPGVAYRKAHENELVCQLCGRRRGVVTAEVGVVAARGRGVRERPEEAMQRAAQLEARGAGRSFALRTMAAILGLAGAGMLLVTLFALSGILAALGIAASTVFLLPALGLFLAGRSLRERYRRDAHEARIRAVMDLARDHQGVLRLDKAAEVLRLPPAQVEPLLSSLVDHQRVKLDIEEDGVLVYRFLDWMPPDRQLPG